MRLMHRVDANAGRTGMTGVALLVIFLGACSLAGAAELPTALCLSGSDWRIHADRGGKGVEPTGTDWTLATVPGNVQADLEAAHQLMPLSYGLGDPRWYDVACKNWWYRKDFVVPADFKGKRITLVFDGVDHQCDIWVNGKRVGSNAGMFRRFWFDVADVVRPGEVNHLAVRIAKIPDELAPMVIGTDGWQSRGTLVAMTKTRQLLHDLKSPTNFGWDWGVNIWTLGIWKDVHLVASGPARIEWTRAETMLSDNYTKAVVTASVEIDSLVEMPAQVSFRISGNGQEATSIVKATLKKGMNQLTTKLPLDHPVLWWCNGQGKQPLYTLKTRVEPLAGGFASDERSTRFGVREVRWILTEGAPKDYISRFQLVLNGRLVRTMGSCMVPPDLLFGRAGPRSLQLLHRAKDAGMNMIRLWGGGIILPEEFYSLADELGVMFSLEFPLANCEPETDALFLGNLETTIRNIVKQVRNHPSIIEYTGGNEMNWNSLSKHPAWVLLQKIVREDDGRLIRATCPDLARAHGPWDFYIDSGYRNFDGSRPMRYGEFGVQTPANLEVWHRDIPQKSQWPVSGDEDPVLARKNIVQAVFTASHWLLKPRIDLVFGSLDNLPELIEAGQFLGAEELRYAMDALRRQGKYVGGFTSWDFDEPWSNGAGTYMVDYDGRTLMNYDFVKQALVPISLTLKYPTIVYDPSTGMDVEVWLTSDAPQAAKGLKWQLLARDRRGTTFMREEGTAAIDPLEVKQLKKLHMVPPKETVLGPFFVELQLRDANDKLVAERLHVFSSRAGSTGSFGGLLMNRGQDSDDDFAIAAEKQIGLKSPANLAFVGNGAKPATASSELPGQAQYEAKGLNDGLYGNAHSWVGNAPKSSFLIDLGKVARVGRFRLGRDRTYLQANRMINYLKIETSLDNHQWTVVFEKEGVANLPGANPFATMEIDTAPGQAQFVRATVDPLSPVHGPYACIDEFEVYAPSGEAKAPLPRVAFHLEPPRVPPVTRTKLNVTAAPTRAEGGREVLELVVTNVGPMTALICEPHPLLEYRTDLFIENNHCFIPPGESRTITIRSSIHPRGGLSLAQTGWRLSTWNADDLVIEPSEDVLLAVGRRDELCREFAGYDEPLKLVRDAGVELIGPRPNTSTLPYLLKDKAAARFDFTIDTAKSGRGGSLRVHTSDQSDLIATEMAIMINGHSFLATLPKGLGIQEKDPAHLAFPASALVQLPPGTLKPGKNLLDIRVTNGGWFTWDALDLIGSVNP